MTVPFSESLRQMSSSFPFDLSIRNEFQCGSQGSRSWYTASPFTSRKTLGSMTKHNSKIADSITLDSIIKNDITGLSQKYHQKLLLFGVGSCRRRAGFESSCSVTTVSADGNEIIKRDITKSNQRYQQKLLLFGVGSYRRRTGLARSWTLANLNADGNEIIKNAITGSSQKYNQKLLLFSVASCKRSAGFARCCSFSNVNADISDHLSTSNEDVANGFIPKTIQQAETVVKESGQDFAATKALEIDTGGGGGGSSNYRGYGGSDDNGKGGDADEEEEAYGPILNSEEVIREAKARGITLPVDLAEAARAVGIEKLLLFRYFQLQGALWPLGSAIKKSSMLRNWMLADPSFLFKLLIEVAIDATCATFAEVQKRGKDFWNEFELYMSDLVVGVVLDITLVCMLAPFVQFGGKPPPRGTMGRLSKALGALPSSMFEAERPGRGFTLYQRVGTLFVKGAQYGVVGFVCGLIGQGFASSIMTFKRKLKKSDEHEVAIPPILPTAALWAVFMAVSSNTRYQIVNGLERVVESSSVAKRVPQFAMAFTIGIRFANNIYGGMQFVDWARWAGVQ
ncbi:hypothetical protein O6H91_11G113400 [Diphasiastrum complanatum]|uniref:Uncharacterized protein n=1 Tax=Diphasiastrum complanatum TaxID=34168 RepID=A0ACC2CCX6_DIPCM|nr:hypothetical protein O6H91_11G113400 [Diphasiastrum complanatum]